jgi:hypothetical protein
LTVPPTAAASPPPPAPGDEIAPTEPDPADGRDEPDQDVVVDEPVEPNVPDPPPAPDTTVIGTTVPVAPPTIGGFRVTGGSGSGCSSTQLPVALAWQSTGAEAAAITGPGAPSGPLPASGTAVACAPVGGPDPTYTLTVSGPGGTASRTSSA